MDYFTTSMASARAALATMFLFTAASHFAPMRKDLIAMVPPSLPRPGLLVFLTGIAELAGAVGLLVPPVTWLWAACGLILLPACDSASDSARPSRQPACAGLHPRRRRGQCS